MTCQEAVTNYYSVALEVCVKTKSDLVSNSSLNKLINKNTVQEQNHQPPNLKHSVPRATCVMFEAPRARAHVRVLVEKKEKAQMKCDMIAIVYF